MIETIIVFVALAPLYIIGAIMTAYLAALVVFGPIAIAGEIFDA